MKCLKKKYIPKAFLYKKKIMYNVILLFAF